jgi:hypothetical protein
MASTKHRSQKEKTKTGFERVDPRIMTFFRILKIKRFRLRRGFRLHLVMARRADAAGTLKRVSPSRGAGRLEKPQTPLPERRVES